LASTAAPTSTTRSAFASSRIDPEPTTNPRRFHIAKDRAPPLCSLHSTQEAHLAFIFAHGEEGFLALELTAKSAQFGSAWGVETRCRGGSRSIEV
jgi:hypothetical protein